MPLSRRYSPEWSPGDSAIVGMDFSAIIPVDVGLVPSTSDNTPRLEIWTNFATPVQTSAPEWNIGAAAIEGRIVYCDLKGGNNGVDYQLRWFVTDQLGNRWTRTGLLHCGLTS